MLIIEGTDGVGKTVLAHKILRQLDGWEYRHFGPLTSSWQFPADYVSHVRERVVMDRFHMSEIAYSPARGELKQRLNAEAYRWLDGHIRITGGFTVVITATNKFINDHYDDEGQLYNIDVHKAANRSFESIVRGTFAPYVPDFDYVIYLNRGYPDDRHVTNIVTRYLERQKETNHAQ